MPEVKREARSLVSNRFQGGVSIYLLKSRQLVDESQMSSTSLSGITVVFNIDISHLITAY